jgi:molybdopterin/thiamine biosynthesis adenylyltransferase/rhodanese-related sulfurtransferase
MLTSEELRRYQRHLSLPGFGLAAQERLKLGRVLVVGAGGLGCPALLYLAAAGVGHILIVDPDRVEASNLQRQVLYSEADVGELKVDIAARRLQALNPYVAVVAMADRFRRENAIEIVQACDVVIDGSDNFATRYLVNDACVMAERPFVYGAIQGFEGQLSVFNWRGGPTYRCLFPSPPPAELVPSCAEAGVLGVLPGVVGTWQASEAIKILAGVGEPLSGRVLLWNALTMNVQTVTLAVDPASRPIRNLPADGESPSCAGHGWEIDIAELRTLLGDGPLQLIDVREDWERSEGAIMPSLHIPLGKLVQQGAKDLLAELRPTLPTVVYCAAGVRSLSAVAILREQFGFRAVRSLRGGIHAWCATDC